VRSEIVKKWSKREEEQEKFYVEQIKQVENFYLERWELSHLKSKLMQIQNGKVYNNNLQHEMTAMSSTATAMSSNDNDIKEIGSIWWLGDSDRRRELDLKKLNFRLKQEYNLLKGINSQQLSKKVDLLTS